MVASDERLSSSVVVVHTGDHVLKEGEAAVSLFTATLQPLMLRFPFMGPVR